MADGLTIEDKIIEQLRKNQELGYAIIGGVSAALIGAAIWALITVSTNYQIGYMAVGVGFLVGFTVRFFGAGVDLPYRIVGAVCALLGCMLGNLFSQVWFIAEAQSLGYFETLAYLDLAFTGTIVKESFNFMDLLFYGIAVYEGYRFAVRDVSDEMITQYNATGTVPPPANGQLRLPIAVVCFAAIGVLLYFILSQDDGVKTFYYESGEKMSQGELVEGKENGTWTVWYPSGQIQLTSNYKNGVEHGEFNWFTEDGVLTRKASFTNGLQHGLEMYFHINGVVADSGNYVEGRKEGLWVTKNAAGMITSTGNYLHDLNDGEWLTFHENGYLASQGAYKKGLRIGPWKFWHPDKTPYQEATYGDDQQITITQSWDIHGKQTINNGNGTLYTYSSTGAITEVSQVKDGKQVGPWTSYRANGSKREAGEFADGFQLVYRTWNALGEPVLTNGSGLYTSFYDSAEQIMFETGLVENGLREGAWVQYYNSPGDTLQTVTYLHGKLNGLVRLYQSGGKLYSQGQMKNDKREGQWAWFNAQGGQESSVAFVNGKKDGTQYFWDANGNVVKEEVYKDDELISVTLNTGEDN